MRPQPLNSAYPSGEKGVDSWWWTGGVRRWQGPRFDASGPHVGQELVGDFSEHLFSQTGHAEDVVSSPVDVVSERNELRRGKETRRGEEREQKDERKQGRVCKKDERNQKDRRKQGQMRKQSQGEQRIQEKER